MARSSADDVELKRACEASIEGSRHNIVLSIRVAKSRGIFGKSAKLGRQMAKARVIAITTKSKGQKTKAFLRVLKYSNGGLLEPAKLYKLKHLSKVEVIQNDPSGCTFMLGFDNLRSQSVAPPHWTMRNKDDRNRLLLCILNISKEVLGRLPKVVGIDIVEMALWAKVHRRTYFSSSQENSPLTTNRTFTEDGVATSVMIQIDTQVTVEKDLLSQAEVDDMEALLGTYVMGFGEADVFSERMKHELQALEAANIHALLESEAIIEEVLHGLEVAIICVEDMDEWLGIFNAKLKHMREDIELVKEKRVELEKLKSTFVWRASEFLRNYFASLVDFMINDKTYFSRRGSLKRPNHAELRYKCRTYAQLLQHLKSLDSNSLGPLRKAYCHSLNLLLRREAREFANELRASTKVGKAPTVWFESSAGSGQTANSEETGVLSEAYSKMLTVFIPLLVDESTFFAHFMCFDVPKLANSSNSGSDGNGETDDDQEGIASGSSTTELSFLNESLQELLDGIQEDFYSLLDWAFKFDPLRCISMHGITERYLSGQKVDTAGFVRLLLDDLETRISMNFGRFVDDCIYMIEKTERNARQLGVLPYIPRFAFLATRMEQYIQGQSRDLVDQTYTKIVSIMFVCLERTAQMEPKYSDIVLLENYAAFQNSLYDLANVVPSLAKFYRQASESYDQACTRHINMIIFITFERLFIFARRMEELMVTITPQEIQFQVGMSKADLRKMLKSSLSGLDKTINAMYKKLQKNLTSEELLPSLWEKCKKDFLDKYGSFVKLVNQIYPGENVPPVSEMRELLAQM
ncbi:exocyst complex component SEC3A isoform X5 [Dendrobium catenatum]|uniref:exocyst complex component SEC3A isoform X5 n=1 Tax=Dendrobium catenatum TaxID=906689 RepID=UPI0010A0683B|nr:exocyst complex component SEC3A isoform X5 [Dendrobium catenatum]